MLIFTYFLIVYRCLYIHDQFLFILGWWWWWWWWWYLEFESYRLTHPHHYSYCHSFPHVVAKMNILHHWLLLFWRCWESNLTLESHSSPQHMPKRTLRLHLMGSLAGKLRPTGIAFPHHGSSSMATFWSQERRGILGPGLRRMREIYKFFWLESEPFEAFQLRIWYEMWKKGYLLTELAAWYTGAVIGGVK